MDPAVMFKVIIVGFLEGIGSKGGRKVRVQSLTGDKGFHDAVELAII